MGCLHRRLGGTSRDLPFVRRFKPREIETATSGFSTALETGGPRGTAYRARFADGLVATVRRAAGGDHEEQEGAFYRELQLLGRLNHHHVVRLRGFSEGHNRFLVFDQMENRSLKECLHGNAQFWSRSCLSGGTVQSNASIARHPFYDYC